MAFIVHYTLQCFFNDNQLLQMHIIYYKHFSLHLSMSSCFVNHLMEILMFLQLGSFCTSIFLIRIHHRRTCLVSSFVSSSRPVFARHMCVDLFTRHVCVDRQASSRRRRGLRRSSFLRLFSFFATFFLNSACRKSRIDKRRFGDGKIRTFDPWSGNLLC